MTHWNRRGFMATGAAAAACLSGVAPLVRSKEEQLRIACIGLGKRGETNATILVGENMVALCDVDEEILLPIADRYPAAKAYTDYREMFEKETLDAVVISTPNHTHAPIALAAMNKGIHVYIEKPLAHNIREVRLIEAKAKEKGVVAWMGNQHHATAGYRRAMELLESKTVGAVKEIHAWTNRPTWAQGVKRPADGSPVPAKLKWDLWLGPAPERSYNPVYHPYGWRGWWDFGGGSLADMGPHLLDPVFWGLKLDLPSMIIPDRATDISGDVAPSWSVIKFQFPARGELPPVDLTWYDGGKLPASTITGTDRPPVNGVMVIGELGKIFIPDLGGAPRVIPNNRGEVLPEPEKKASLNRAHHQIWLDLIREKKPDSDYFSKCCRLTELCLMGNIAIRVNEKLRVQFNDQTKQLDKWNEKTKAFEADPQLKQMLSRTYRKGWELPK